MAVPLFALLALCVDVFTVMFIGAVQLSPSFINNPFIALWAGGLIRTALLLFLSFSYSGSPAWMRGIDGVQTAVVHGLLYPVYISFLWACGRSTVELVWGWHTWQGVRCASIHLTLTLCIVHLGLGVKCVTFFIFRKINVGITFLFKYIFFLLYFERFLCY